MITNLSLERRHAPLDLISLQKELMELQNIIISMPDRSRPGKPTNVYAIGTLQGGYDKLDTGSNNNNNIIQRTHNNKQLSTSTKRRINLPKHITTIGTWNVRTLREISNLRFADDIDLLAGSEAELQSLTDSLEKATTSFGMEISHIKSKTLVNGETEAPKIMMYSKALENVSNFKYLGATLSDDATSKKEIRIRLAMATSVMVKLEKIWRSKEIVFKIKCKLYKSLVITTLLYGCETWTLYQE